MSMSQIIVRMVFDNGSIETHSAVKTSWNSTLPDLTYWTLCVSFTQVNKYIPLRHHYPTVWHMSQVFRLWILWIIGGGQTEDPNLYEGIIFGRAVAEWKKIARGYLIKWPLSEHQIKSFLGAPAKCQLDINSLPGNRSIMPFELESFNVKKEMVSSTDSTFTANIKWQSGSGRNEWVSESTINVF